MQPAYHPTEGLFAINRAIDAIFLLDLVLQFSLMYQAEEGREGSRWISSRALIARHYLRGCAELSLDLTTSGWPHTGCCC